MKIKTRFSVWGAILLIMLLSGCNIIMDPKSLMKVPELSSDKETLKSVVYTELKGANLLRPRDDNDLSSIRVVDLNKDGVMEAVVFYETPEETVKVHGLILENDGNTWVPKVHFDGDGQALQSFQLKDVTGDGQINIVAGFSSGEPQKELLIVYSYTGENVERILELPYNYFIIDDLNGDDQLDITIVSLKKDQNTTITTYQYTDSFQELDRLQLENAVSGFYNVVHGSITSDLRGIILDVISGEHSGYSLVIAMQDGKLVDLIPDQSATLKDYQIMSGDVNNDGILEIGMLERPKGWEYIAPNDIPWLSSYYNLDPDKGLTFVMQEYMDLDGRFYFSLPEEWWGKVTIDIESVKNEYLRFVEIDTQRTLVEIRFFSLTEWEQVKEEWVLIARDNDKVIGYLSHTDLKVNKGEKEIKR